MGTLLQIFEQLRITCSGTPTAKARAGDGSCATLDGTTPSVHLHLHHARHRPERAGDLRGGLVLAPKLDFDLAGGRRGGGSARLRSRLHLKALLHALNRALVGEVDAHALLVAATATSRGSAVMMRARTSSPSRLAWSWSTRGRPGSRISRYWPSPSEKMIASNARLVREDDDAELVAGLGPALRAIEDGAATRPTLVVPDRTARQNSAQLCTRSLPRRSPYSSRG